MPAARRLTRGRALLLAALFALSGAALITPSATASAAAAAAESASGQNGAEELRWVRLDKLHPTQGAVGHDQVHYKLGRYASTKDEDRGKFNKKYDDWCEANGQGEAASVRAHARLDKPGRFSCTIPEGQETADSVAAMKTVVVGPRDRLYLTDGHHTFTSFWETPDGGPKTKIRVRVAADLSHLDKKEFWAEMEQRGWVWLRDGGGRKITADQLPGRLGLDRLDDDPYRALVYFTRDIGYQKPAKPVEFLEFYWGAWLRDDLRLSLDDYDLDDHADYLRLVEDASRAMVALPGTTELADGRTADGLGRLATWNAKEFAKLSTPMADAKPGKLAYALNHRLR
ncbi:ParB/Srx family N-terminal domain-containing protein [Streptomyces alkaliterrae]|uniref:Chromosome partitioning protein ParB n=1 Tax=Streptomyces alkaliterrae TaxID=2213162 RepID=A0A5P0YYB7_9ACTN|nr:ParB/Srx family N-terminal domain-containing protein [Streptomyces alkaliterrae]MBB1255102.1 chromosome partitioning protein ParB [Streptomyces alkaliterrae]MBB1259545.1 chromosome partitioning protein ParB [Streptomyces alkaliterrae]MQS05281.1 chromosome partitioning protein ParB [Streptomyces alkaliterrae]